MFNALTSTDWTEAPFLREIETDQAYPALQENFDVVGLINLMRHKAGRVHGVDARMISSFSDITNYRQLDGQSHLDFFKTPTELIRAAVLQGNDFAPGSLANAQINMAIVRNMRSTPRWEARLDNMRVENPELPHHEAFLNRLRTFAQSDNDIDAAKSSSSTPSALPPQGVLIGDSLGKDGGYGGRKGNGGKGRGGGKGTGNGKGDGGSKAKHQSAPNNRPPPQVMILSVPQSQNTAEFQETARRALEQARDAHRDAYRLDPPPAAAVDRKRPSKKPKVQFASTAAAELDGQIDQQLKKQQQ